MSEPTSGLFRISVAFIDRSGEPLTGPNWRVTVWDRDPVVDDRLCSGKIDEGGRAEMMFSVADVMSLDSPGERKPDLFFELMHRGETVFVSPVFDDVDFESRDPVSGSAHELTRVFGPFRVDWPPID